MPRAERIMLYLREDDTVDIEGAIKESSAVAPLSSDLTERLKGKHLDTDDTWFAQEPVEPTESSSRVRIKELALLETKKDLARAEEERDRMLKEAGGTGLQDREEHEAYIRWADQQMCLAEGCRASMLLASIDLLLERAGALLERDLEKTTISEWDLAGHTLKLLVAEFSLLDKMVAPYIRLQRRSADTASLPPVGLDYSELHLLEAKIVHFADRVGANVDGVEVDHAFLESLRRRAAGMRKGWQKLRCGLSFYGNGSRILAQDIQHVVKLILKAVFLKQRIRSREAQVCYRAVKDILVLLPVLVILLIPLSPPGHVFVLSLLTKIFPDFFPSPFTERRQNVMKVYNEIKPADPT